VAETQLGSITADMEDTVHRAIGCGITVHRILGPGFKETIYDQAFCLELNDAGLQFEREKRILVPYKHWQLPGHRVDLIVEGIVLIELKAIPRLRPLHTRQVVSYLKATGLRLGLLMNFNVSVLRDGIRRIVV
jgi:GxxExxY protein